MIRWEELEISAAGMGEENPLADIDNIEYIHAGYDVTERVTEDERKWLGKGMISTILPYTIQDNFNRDRRMRKFHGAVLENEYLRAVFLPELGGRLWSLWDKEKNRELLYKNPVFQPANLAIRNAWFAGGVEFNVGIKGHNPLTCDPLFARIAQTRNGEEVLQIYEWERIRKVAFGINAYLPEGSRILYLRDTVENLSDEQTFMYWWSNIAVPETPGTRVIVPAEKAFLCKYEEGHYILDKTAIPWHDGVDVSYPERLRRSLDFFYQIPVESKERWIAALGEDGVGLAQMSTAEMKGRKLFLWGQGTGGRNWGDFLSDGSGRYLEIQAGLEYTQLEHIPMEAGASWSWTEAYLGVACDPDRVHDGDWNVAQAEVSAQLHKALAADGEDQCIDSFLRGVVPEKFISFRPLMYGSGFGSLEELARGCRISRHYDFYPEALGDKQEGWRILLQEGYLPEIAPEDYSASYVAGPEWEERLLASLQREAGRHWYAWYQLGVVQYGLGKRTAAREAFEQSVACKPNAWSYRNLAMLHKQEGDVAQAAQLMLIAVARQKKCINLYLDCASCLIAAELFEQCISLYEGLPESMKQRGRMRLYLTMAYMGLGQYRTAAAILNTGFKMDDIREGEISISHLWAKLYREIVREENPAADETVLDRIRQEKYPLPKALDFRMHE